MKKIFIVTLHLLCITTTFAQTKWVVDPIHSSIRFSVSHMVISDVEGAFNSYSGYVISATPDFADAKIEFSADINSLDTDNKMRDDHLKSDDFFNATRFPKMTFKSVEFKKISGNKYSLTGNLTIRDVTKKIKFDVVFGGTSKDGYGNVKSGFKATTVINRFDYNLKWNKLTEAGGAMVGKDVAITLKLEFTKEKA